MYSATTENEDTLQHIFYACKTICNCSWTIEGVLHTMIRCVLVHTDSLGGHLSICCLIWNMHCKCMSAGSKKHCLLSAFIVMTNLSIKLKNHSFLDIC